jgi:hypothetical protein
LIFDTDAADRTLATWFPERASVIDLDRVPDQMKLFDTLSAAYPESQVIDLTHRSFQKFFKLMRDTDYGAEARSRGIEPVIFYIPDRDPESYEQGRVVRDYFKNCSFVLVENQFLGEISKETRGSHGYHALRSHNPRMTLPKLDLFLAGAINDPNLSLSEFMRRTQSKGPPAPVPAATMSLAYLSLETRAGITAWLREVFGEIHRVIEEVKSRPVVSEEDPFKQ